jgi:hypothetical protein
MAKIKQKMETFRVKTLLTGLPILRSIRMLPQANAHPRQHWSCRICNQRLAAFVPLVDPVSSSTPPGITGQGSTEPRNGLAVTLTVLDCLIFFLKYDDPTLTYVSFRNPMGDKAFNDATKRPITIFKPCHSIQARRF